MLAFRVIHFPIVFNFLHWIFYTVQMIYSVEIKYIGCYNDDNNRMLDDQHFYHNQLTLEVCKQLCHGHRYLGLQNYNECYCGNALGDANVYQRKNEDECNRTCTGYSSQICGGYWLSSVYEFIPTTTMTTKGHSTVETAKITTNRQSVPTAQIITLGQSEVTTDDIKTPGKSQMTTLQTSKPEASKVTTTEVTMLGQLDVITTDRQTPSQLSVTTLQVAEAKTYEVTTIKTAPIFGISELTSVQPMSPLACLCPCPKVVKGKWDFLRGMNLTLDQLGELLKPELDLMKKELSVNKSDTTIMRRSKISAPDDRVSATSVGYVGVVFIGFIAVLIVLFDILGCFVAKFKRRS